MRSFDLGRRLRLIVGVATTMALAAMLLYPGGTARDPLTRGYSLSHNFLSDLGMTVAYNHEPNRLGALCFATSLLLLVVGSGHAVSEIVRFLATDAASRRSARLAGLAVLLACVGFAGVAVTPENALMPLHIGFTIWAWRIVPAIALLLGFAAHQHARLRHRAAVVWFGAAFLLGMYAALLTWGPSVGDPGGLFVQVIAQKVATVVLLAAVLIGTAETQRAANKGSAVAVASSGRAG